jgi:molybdenum cofactor cytidylyltransferase
MDLFDAFDLKPGAVVAAVGGGGKTSLVYALGDQAATMGLAAIVASTTKFTRRSPGPMPPIIETTDDESVQALRDAVSPGSVVVASAGAANRGRMEGYRPETIDAWAASLIPGLIAVEADGSAHRPFKAPADHEPVIPSSATDVIVCVGLDVLGKALTAANVHRPETATRLGRTELGTPVTIETILRVLTHDDGGRKGVPPTARLHALLNGPGDEEQRALGAKLAGRLIFGGYYRAIVGTIHRAEIDTIAC